MVNPSSPKTQPAKRYDVVVRGAGIVGRTLALLFAQERLKVALVEPARPADHAQRPDVRAYAINAASKALLESVRAWPSDGQQPAATTPVMAMEVHGDAGGELDFLAGDAQVDALAWIVDVPGLEARLANAVEFQGSIDCLSEAPAAAPLTVICEGKRSRTREALGIEFDTRPYPHKAIAARLQCEKQHGGIARQWFRDGQIMALLPLGGAEGNSVALVWSLNKAEADEWLSKDAADLTQAIGERCDHALGDMTLEHAPQAWPLERSRARQWTLSTATGGVALAGDAAHAMHPLAGQGLNVGLGDVAALAKVMREREYWRSVGDPKLLRRYERSRQADVSAMSLLTDGLFGLFEHRHEAFQTLRNRGLSGVNRLGPVKQWLTRQAMGL
ncbi:FAD-dependent monooxygenase [Hydrogenophaga sp. 5NK40-0174]|uniref:FAD-dependent monooxygenase n=1 Tax=Hydrogenophaga sp. 5NK40-0174 TaxID=3127649 RepID=UPI0031057E14